MQEDWAACTGQKMILHLKLLQLLLYQPLSVRRANRTDICPDAVPYIMHEDSHMSRAIWGDAGSPERLKICAVEMLRVTEHLDRRGWAPHPRNTSTQGH